MDSQKQPPPASGMPRLSRLPVPKSSVQNLRQNAHSSAEKKYQTLTERSRPASIVTSRSRAPLSSTQSNSRAPPPHNRTASTIQDGIFKKPVGRPTVRPSQLQLRQTSGSSGKSNTEESLASIDSLWSASRSSSRQGHHNGEDTNTVSSSEEPNTPKEVKSLSERTIESLSHTPAKLRRKSSFFTPESPMAPFSRPASAFGQPTSRPTSPNAELHPMPSVPSLIRAKPRPLVLATSVSGTPHKRTESAAAAKLVRAQSPTKASAMRSVEKTTPLTPKLKTTTRAPIRGSKTISGRVQQPRPALADLFSTSKPMSQESVVGTAVGTPKPKVLAKKKIAQQPDESSPKAAQAAKSSMALREQIRKAKAERRSLGATQNNTLSTTTDPAFEPIKHADPFNQQPKDGKAVLRQRVVAARSDGRLNIAAMGLKAIPEEVLKMYDYDVIQQSATAWNEVVDLIRFVAADNDIETISDDAFPDVDPNAYSEDNDAKGPQFGGIEVLDLHGNILFDVPRGLRFLERLTMLNLSRNRLMNDALETIAQITSLRELKIADNLFTGELTSIEALHNLEVLEIQDNKISSLPDELCELVKLRILNVSNNHLTNLPMESLARTLVVELLASKNKIAGPLFASESVTLPRLQVLDVSINSLSTLLSSKGEETPELPSLRELNVAYNQLTRLPPFSTWESLTTIFAADNKISNLPAGFVESTTIRSADFSGNDFSKLDERIATMPALENFQVAANPLRERKYLTMNTEDLKKSLEAKLAPVGFVE